MKYDARTAERTGIDWLRAALAPAGDFGRRAEDAARPFGPGDAAAARARCASIVTLAQTLTADGVLHLRAALRRAPDPIDVVSRANAGDPLADVDFYEVGRFGDALDAIASAWDAAGGDAPGRPPVVAELGALLARGRQGGSFYLADTFAAGLAAARLAYTVSDVAVMRERERLARQLTPHIEAPTVTLEEFILMRDDVPTLPAGIRIVRETPAYRLVAFELDDAALAATVQHERALQAVSQAEERARRDLATAVADLGPALLAAAAQLGELDRTLARVAFTQAWGGCVPDFSQGRFAFEGGSFVPLRAALAAAGLPYTAISIDLQRVAVLTGPNMGGKSAALATCGFLAACVVLGVPPPAQSATLPLFTAIDWIGGDVAGDRERFL